MLEYKIKLKELCKIYSPTNARIKDIRQLTKKAAEDLMDLQFTIPNKGKKNIKITSLETVKKRKPLNATFLFVASKLFTC